MLGKNPTGYIIFTAEGRMMSIVEAEGRKVPQTDEESAVALRTMFAYTGIFRLEGDNWTTKVDVAWTPAWNRTDQVRSFKLDGDRLEVTSGLWGEREPREDDSRRSDVGVGEVATPTAAQTPTPRSLRLTALLGDSARREQVAAAQSERAPDLTHRMTGRAFFELLRPDSAP